MSSGDEAADGIERQRDCLAHAGEAFPTQRSAIGMGGGGQHAAQHREIAAQRLRLPQFGGAVAGRGDRHGLQPADALRQRCNCAARRCTPMPSSRARSMSPLTSTSAFALRHSAAASAASARQRGRDSPSPGARSCTRRMPRRQRLRQGGQPRLAVVARLRRDQVAIGLQQRRHHRAIGRRHRIADQFLRRHPGQRLAFHARAACPARRSRGARPGAGACPDIAAAR